MARKSYSASAAGSLMLMGEHAVLEGKLALVCAVDKRIRVTLQPNTSDQITIHDSKLGDLNFALSDLAILAPFKFVTSAILLFKDQIKTGFVLNIQAEFSNEMGLGSSAAVTSATIAVLAAWLHPKPLTKLALFKLARQAVLNVQGVGSGADLAASIYGGVLAFKSQPAKIIPLPIIPALAAVYCGYKTPTPEVIAIVSAAKQQQPKLYSKIFAAMHECVMQAVVAIKSANWSQLGSLFKQHQGLQAALGTSNQLLDGLLGQLNARSEILGAKISGSGLGDCIIGLGNLPPHVFPLDAQQSTLGVQQLTINIAAQGLVYDYN